MRVCLTFLSVLNTIGLLLFLSSCKSYLSVDSQESGATASPYEAYDLRNFSHKNIGSLTHYFNFDDSDIEDYGANKSVVTPSGNPILGTSNLLGKSAVFNGALDGVDDFFEFNLKDESYYSFSYWIYNDSSKEVTTQYLMNSGLFWIHDRGAQRPVLEVTATDGSRVRFKVGLGDVYDQDKWTHIVMTVDLSNPFTGNSSGLAKIYINGQKKVVSVETEATAGLGARANGIARFGNSLNSARPFVGKYDEIGIFNKILSDAEVLKIYNAQKQKVYTVNFDGINTFGELATPWAPRGANWEIEVELSWDDSVGGNVYPLATNSSISSIYIDASGLPLLKYEGSYVTANITRLTPGANSSFKFSVTATDVKCYVNGVLEKTIATTKSLTVPWSVIGAHSSHSSKFKGEITRVKFTDLVTPANSLDINFLLPVGRLLSADSINVNSSTGVNFTLNTDDPFILK